MIFSDLLSRALDFEFLSAEEGLFLFKNASTSDLMYTANELRKKQVPHNKVTWIIDRNVNTTNVCIANCKFCNFFRRPGHDESYITDIETYKIKIEETFRFGGDQLLLQGGHHPDLGLQFYVDLFKQLKQLYPTLKLHSLGPPEIAHIAKLEGISHTEVLKTLMTAGLDSLPGAGAEILNDRVRRLISKGKCGGQEWLDVMRAAHQLLCLLEETRPLLPTIKLPLLLFRSATDHTLPASNSEIIVREIGSSAKEEVVLHNSYHVAPLDHDQRVIFNDSLRFIRELRI